MRFATVDGERDANSRGGRVGFGGLGGGKKMKTKQNQREQREASVHSLRICSQRRKNEIKVEENELAVTLELQAEPVRPEPSRSVPIRLHAEKSSRFRFSKSSPVSCHEKGQTNKKILVERNKRKTRK